MVRELFTKTERKTNVPEIKDKEGKKVLNAKKQRYFFRKLSGKAFVFAILLLCLSGTAAIILYDHFHYNNYPLHIPLQLSSHFGELRADHFHMGLDIRTKGRENLAVYAIKDGYISRLKIEEGNTGKCLYVTHADGTMSVYGHLNAFFNELENYVHQKQYRDHSWNQDIRFDSLSFPVKKGMFIAYSGNTGRSEAPHLHFEIRDALTGKSINPNYSGMKADDHTPPDLKGIYWYDKSGSIYEESAHPVYFNEQVTLGKPVLVSSSVIGLGIAAVDRIDDKHYSEGVTKASVEMDGHTVFMFSLDSLSESETRYINASIDYPLWYNTGKYIQILFQLPGNHLKTFKCGNGLLYLHDRKVHKVVIHYGDAQNNNAETVIFIKYTPPVKKKTEHTFPDKLSPNTSHWIIKPDLRLYFPSTCLYDTIVQDFKKVSPVPQSLVSPVYNLGDGSIPVQDSVLIGLSTYLPAQSKWRYKTVMELKNKKSRLVVKGYWEGNWMLGKFSELGTIRLITDTVPPVIEPYGWTNHHFFSTGEPLQFTCHDGSGLQKVEAEVDGKWILISKKNDLYTYSFDEHCPTGKHRLVIHAVDIAGNSSSETWYFQN